MHWKPWLSKTTTVTGMPSATAVTISELSIRYDPSPTITTTCRSGSASLTPRPAGDLVAHARVAVLEVVGLGVLGAPQLQQVAGQAARGADHRGVAADRLVDDADDLGLGEDPVRVARAAGARAVAVDDGVPFGLLGGDPLAVRRRTCPVPAGVAEWPSASAVERLAGVGDHRRRARSLAASRARDVDADEA